MRGAAGAIWLVLWLQVMPTWAQVPAQPPASYPTSQTPPSAARNNRDDRPLATRQTSFAIPFAVDAASGKVAEVHLYVSSDLGINWHLYSKQKPGVGNFQFRAARDGEYWFTSKTMDPEGRISPAGPFTAELKVLIDTVMPRLTFTAVVGSGGDVKTTWEAQDEHLDARSFSIEYQPSPGANWEPVAIDSNSSSSSQGSIRGEITWWPKTPAKVINVKAEVRDLAGNPAVANKRLFLPALANRRPPTQQNAPTPGAVADPFARYRSNNSPDTASALAKAPGQPPAFNPGNQTSNSLPPVPPSSPDTSNSPAAIGQFVSSSKFAAGTAPPDLTRGAPATTSPRPVTGELPAGERPRMTNQKKFALDYDIESVGPGGVEQIELWGTKDKGATWTRWGVDTDKQSPYEVEVESEGIFGFRIVVVSKSGLASPAPQPGDAADLWVGVDVTSPVAQFASVSYGEGTFAGQLDIRWHAEDAGLGSRPISLSFSETANGPWNSIASGLPNNGQYYWLVDSRVPKKVFLRLEVRDEAANTTTHQLPEPINLAGLTPGARIRGVYSP